MKCLVWGSGSWATALAWVLSQKGFHVGMWCRRAERAQEIAGGQSSLLPDARLGPLIYPIVDSEGLEHPFDLGIAAVPTQHLRETLTVWKDSIPEGLPWVSASKGLELKTFRLPSEILVETGVATDVSVLSGPSHAEEVVRGVPTALTLGHEEVQRGRWMQQTLSLDTFRVYWSSDPRGVELGGALKNVIALAAGIAIGYGFGDNTLAALITRGAVEIARLGVALGGRRETFSGLSGIGDLIVTCFSEHSRNRAVGIRIGRGEKLADVLAGMVQVAEGVPTTQAVVELSRELGVDMPISDAVFRIVHEGRRVEDGIKDLLGRSLKEE